MEKDHSKFQAILDEHHIWPTEYIFKFVVLAGQVDELANILDDERIVLKPSSKGKYIRVTLQTIMNSSNEVIKVYEKVGQMEGVIAL
jgi:putative lipoic acid-binding regulatory protein